MGLCEAGRQVLADRGFPLFEEFFERNCQLIAPSFSKNQVQLSGQEVTTSRRISSSRIIFERAIGHPKKGQIMANTVHTTVVDVYDEVIAAVAGLANRQGGQIVNENLQARVDVGGSININGSTTAALESSTLRNRRHGLAPMCKRIENFLPLTSTVKKGQPAAFFKRCLNKLLRTFFMAMDILTVAYASNTDFILDFAIVHQCCIWLLFCK